ncbi:hypothetical protein BVG16_08865 [Paenibacillus selenitireducens]|uniref:Uncharacterized protein n=1 Tax=Paenibacillus selenitireducens TaxID=1324314 RepID=A0A1T2XH31_9BACL|nr:alpha/beta fold hydrolase [Paenibacillus selenitireducens]OPA79197.1 hypothetical protein BVG16_08865 [Paenibacillus selenitireducens]
MQMHRMRKTPLVFVPGVFGSRGDMIIPGTGRWSFGAAGAIYDPFVRQLEQLGYERNISLFIAFYDWRQPLPNAAQTFLVHTIQEAKRKTGARHVNLLGHSMGGLVSRAYVQSDYYQDDVNQLIVLCSPNAGSPANYAYWTGATLEHHSEAPVNVVSLYMDRYLSYLTQISPLNRVEAIHMYFPSLLDCVPSQDYGNYVIVNASDSKRFVPYQTLGVQNLFLDALNRDQDILKRRNIEVTLIAGMGHNTIQYLQENHCPLTFVWNAGPVWDTVNSDAGDGNVMMKSVFTLEGDQHVIEAGHIEALFISVPLLKKKLT